MSFTAEQTMIIRDIDAKKKSLVICSVFFIALLMGVFVFVHLVHDHYKSSPMQEMKQAWVKT